MRKLPEVMRLRYELKLGYQQIGRRCAIGVGTVHKLPEASRGGRGGWPLPESWDETTGKHSFPSVGEGRRDKPGAAPA